MTSVEFDAINMVTTSLRCYVLTTLFCQRKKVRGRWWNQDGILPATYEMRDKMLEASAFLLTQREVVPGMSFASEALQHFRKSTHAISL